jgi:hypothetical protein
MKDLKYIVLSINTFVDRNLIGIFSIIAENSKEIRIIVTRVVMWGVELEFWQIIAFVANRT